MIIFSSFSFLYVSIISLSVTDHILDKDKAIYQSLKLPIFTKTLMNIHSILVGVILAITLVTTLGATTPMLLLQQGVAEAKQISHEKLGNSNILWLNHLIKKDCKHCFAA
jgi:hypothetical protein